MKLQNETVLITGSTAGIGKKTAEILLQEGCRVAVCSRSEQKVAAALSELKVKFGDRVTGAACDVSNPDDLDSMVRLTLESFGSVRVLIANAGISPVYGPFEYIKGKQLAELSSSIINTNLQGTINSVAAVLPQMTVQKYGRIITLSGGGASRPVRNFSLYSASKGGVNAFSRCLAAEFKNTGRDIKINIFQPGPMKTDLNKKLNLVNGWKDKEAFHKEWEGLLDSVDLNMEKCCRRIIPYISPKCKANGKEFIGFSLIGMLPKLIKIQKIMKNL